jgi:hypothetical protein
MDAKKFLLHNQPDISSRGTIIYNILEEVSS